MNVLITEPTAYSLVALELYEDVGNLLPFMDSLSCIERIIPEVDVLVVRLGIHFDSRLLMKAKRLKYIVTPTTGLDHIDQLYCHENSIEIISLKGEVDFLKTITPTAELTWGLLLGLIRKIPAGFKSVLNGTWNRNLFLGIELKGKTLGVIGFGRLGQMVARYGDAFGMDVIYNDTGKLDVSLNAKYTSLMVLLAKSDVVSVHLPLEDDTRNFIDAEKISKMKRGAILINTSRGGIIDEDALLSALESGEIFGAALDVLANELSDKDNWAKTDALVEYARNNENLIITPHIGGACPDSMRKTEQFCAEAFTSFFNKKNMAK